MDLACRWTGKPLELINPALSNNQGQNWAFSAANTPSPGAANASAIGDIAPFILDVEHRPAVPTSSDPISIVAELRDEAGESITERFSTASPARTGPFQSLPMFDDGVNSDVDARDGIYGGPSSATDGTVIEFYIESSDGTQTRTWPNPADNGQTANALLQVDDEANDIATLSESSCRFRVKSMERHPAPKQCHDECQRDPR